MRIFKLIEKKIEYTTIECIGPLEYVDAKCFVLDNEDKCMILYMENTMLSNRKVYSQVELEIKRKEYYVNSKLHRDNGPAIISVINKNKDTKVEYWLNGIKYDIQKYQIKLRKEKIKRLNLLQ